MTRRRRPSRNPPGAQSTPLDRTRSRPKAEKERFFDLARRFKESSDPAESEPLREELARLTFGD